MRIITAVKLLLVFVAGAAGAQAPAGAGKSAPPELKWGPAPAIFPAGAQMAVLQGNPGGTELFTVRLRMPSGYKIPPHVHPTDEHVTVISGTFLVGMGKTFDAKHTMELKAGGFVTAPAQEAHYAMAKGPTIVQVHALGPFAMTYVNPADTPPAASSK
jgi:quercetin dioxygenase-like cupin family protein